MADKDYEIKQIGMCDVYEIKNILIPEISGIMSDRDITKNIIRHINKGMALKLVSENRMLAFWMSLDKGNFISLSHFYATTEIRKKYPLFFFFMNCLHKTNKKPIYIYANKNIQDYERYFEPTKKKNLYRFVGLR